MPPPEDNLPESLRQKLIEADHPNLFVSPGVDDRVLGEARAHFARARRHRMRRWFLPGAGIGVAAAAAGIAVVLWLGDPVTAPPAPPPTAEARPTILEAFALARLREAGDASITRAQIDHAIAQAVTLPKESM